LPTAAAVFAVRENVDADLALEFEYTQNLAVLDRAERVLRQKSRADARCAPA